MKAEDQAIAVIEGCETRPYDTGYLLQPLLAIRRECGVVDIFGTRPHRIGSKLDFHGARALEAMRQPANDLLNVLPRQLRPAALD
ncbi:MAG TPA: hypothetical protein VN605_07025, partial [Thermoanaerobaculia bacterium]|nr:hypothetical protein [Thermoanaerobaculia bacterium]